MTAKAQVLEAIQGLPEQAGFEEIRQRVELVGAIRHGRQELVAMVRAGAHAAGQASAPKRYQILLTPTAMEELKALASPASRATAQSAEQFAAELCARLAPLSRFTRIGRPVREGGDAGIWELLFQSCRVLYAIDDDLAFVGVFRVWPGNEAHA